jgi:predicted RNA-binding protein with RPS1 domain
MPKSNSGRLVIQCEEKRPRYINGQEIPNWQQGPSVSEVVNYLVRNGWLLFSDTSALWRGYGKLTFIRPKRYLRIRAETELLKMQFAYSGDLAPSYSKIWADPSYAEWQKRITKYAFGERIKVKITRIEDFGAFAELEPGVLGLIHKSKMAWGGVADPSEVVKPGDVVEVSIEKIDKDKQQIGLSMLTTESDPLSNVRVGERLTGIVNTIQPFGIIVELKPGVSGLVHISQISEDFVSPEQLNKLFRIGEEVKVVVLEIDMNNRRLLLSIKQA